MCFRFQGSVCLLLALLVACTACHSSPAFGEDPPLRLSPQTDWEARIEAALDAKGEWEFQDVPLSEACAAIQEKLGIDVALDTKALEDFAIDTATPITLSIAGISNRSCLRLMLNDLELSFTTRLGALWITTPECVEAQLTTKVHPVGDLLVRDATRGDSASDYSLLLQAIKENFQPDSWDEVGGPATILGIYDSIVVSQTLDIHQQVTEFLAAYRVIIDEDDRNADEKQTLLLGENEVSTAIRRALDQPFTAELEDQSLVDVLQFVSQKMGIPVVIDVRALEDFGIDTSTPVSARFTETPLRFALTRMLGELELTYIIRDEVLLVTTPERAEAQLLIGLYPVRDLVEVGAESVIDPLNTRFDFAPLIGAIQSTILPDSWDSVGGPAGIATLLPVPTIVISQTQEAHDEIAELLAKLHATKALEAARSAAKEAVDPAALIIRSYPIYPAFHAPDEIANLVMRASEPGTWDDDAGTFVQGLGASIVVKHNASGHRQVQKLLTQLELWSSTRRGGKGPAGGGGGGGLGGAPPGAQPAATGGGGGFF